MIYICFVPVVWRHCHVERIHCYRLKLIVDRSLAERIRVRKLVDERVKVIIKQLQVWFCLLIHKFAAVLQFKFKGTLHVVMLYCCVSFTVHVSGLLIDTVSVFEYVEGLTWPDFKLSMTDSVWTSGNAINALILLSRHQEGHPACKWVSSFLTAHQHIKGYFMPLASRLLRK